MFPRYRHGTGTIRRAIRIRQFRRHKHQLHRKENGLSARGTLVVIDYLQLLDQKRGNPELMDQVHTLKAFARDKGLIIVFISPIDQLYDPLTKLCPDLEDVRLPNPLDLRLFNKICFLNSGDVQFGWAGQIQP